MKKVKKIASIKKSVKHLTPSIANKLKGGATEELFGAYHYRFTATDDLAKWRK